MELQIMWGWQPALYLFLGGLGAGAFLTAGVLYLKDACANRNLLAASCWAALLCLGVGLILLLSELTAPLRGLMMWQSFSHLTSWMAIGAWLAFCALVMFFLAALRFTPFTKKWIAAHIPAMAKRKEPLTKAVVIAGMVFALGVAVYTGILLMSAPGIGLWNTLLLPCLFTVSAVDTGIALVELMATLGSKKLGLSHGAEAFLRRCVVVLVVLEACVLTALLVWARLSGTTAADSAALLMSGSFAPAFWGLLVVCGLALPLVIAVVGLVKSKGAAAQGAEHGASPVAAQPAQPAAQDASPAAPGASKALGIIGPVGALAGGCALRFLIVYAGAHADLITATLMQLPL